MLLFGVCFVLYFLKLSAGKGFQDVFILRILFLNIKVRQECAPAGIPIYR